MSRPKTTAERHALVSSLVRNSALDSRSRILSSFYGAIDHAGWLIELGRTNVRFLTGNQLPHQAFAEFLGLGSARKYRIAVHRVDRMRESLIELGRFCLTLQICDDLALNRVVKSVEYVRWGRAIGLDASNRLRRRGRRTQSSQYTATSARADELEAMRLRTGMTLKDWSYKLGTSENTYRSHMLEDNISDEWLDNGKRIILSQAQREKRRTESYNSVTEKELNSARETVWKSYEQQRDKLMVGRDEVDKLNVELDPIPPPPDQEAEIELLDTEPEVFEPSEEVEIDFLAEEEEEEGG